MAKPERPRAAAAVMRMDGKEILLVKHRWRDGTTSWILPGGGLLPGETPEEAALRELDEETGLKGSIARYLFTMPYDRGVSTTFLVEVDPAAHVSLGYDPEELNEETKTLQDVAWFSLEDVRQYHEMQLVIASLREPQPAPHTGEEN